MQHTSVANDGIKNIHCNTLQNKLSSSCQRLKEVIKEDLDRIMELWLETNISAHSFIKDEYWSENFDVVKGMMPNANIYLYEENDIIQGFVGLMDDYIAGIFVSGNVKGFLFLMNKLMEIRVNLNLIWTG